MAENKKDTTTKKSKPFKEIETHEILKIANRNFNERPKSRILFGAALFSFISLVFTYLTSSAFEDVGINRILFIFLSILFGIAVMLVFTGLHALGMWFGRKIPKFFRGEIANAIGFFFKAQPIPSASIIFASWFSMLFVNIVIAELPFPIAMLWGPLPTFGFAVFGGVIFYILSKDFKKVHIAKKIISFVFLSFFVIILLSIIHTVFSSGSNDGLNEYTLNKPAFDYTIKPENPLIPGRYQVKILTYGSGKDRIRECFSSGVNIKTESVDASNIFKPKKGINYRFRKSVWGFDNTALPLNGRVWYPDMDGKFPIVLIVHGNHSMLDFSDPGYAYLCEHLASRGYVAISIDENFLNGWFFGGYPGKESENCLRGWLLLKHLEALEKMNKDTQSPLYDIMDFNRIALVGHSRGGEAIVHAAILNRVDRFPADANIPMNFEFNIKTLIAIAPADRQYDHVDKPAVLSNINYFVLQGSHDSDVSIFMGLKQYQRIEFTDDNYWCKAMLFVYRANHGNFNSTWGRYNLSPPLGWLINTKPLLSMENQEKISRSFITAFLEGTLTDKTEYLHVFKDYRIEAENLPRTFLKTRFEDTSSIYLATYEDDHNPVSGSLEGVSLEAENFSIWHEEDIPFRAGGTECNYAIELGWNVEDKPDKLPVYRIFLPGSITREIGLTENSSLIFSIADTGSYPNKDKILTPYPEKENPIDFTIKIITHSGEESTLPLSAFSPLQEPWHVRLLKSRFLEKMFIKNDFEIVLESYRFPLKWFQTNGNNIKINEIKEIDFIFDKNRKGAIYLDDLGFSVD